MSISIWENNIKKFVKVQMKNLIHQIFLLLLLFGEVVKNETVSTPARYCLIYEEMFQLRKDMINRQRHDPAASINNNVIFSPKEPSKAEVCLFKSLTVIFNLMTKSSQKTKIYWLLYLFPIVHFYGELSTLASTEWNFIHSNIYSLSN